MLGLAAWNIESALLQGRTERSESISRCCLHAGLNNMNQWSNNGCQISENGDGKSTKGRQKSEILHQKTRWTKWKTFKRTHSTWQQTHRSKRFEEVKLDKTAMLHYRSAEACAWLHQRHKGKTDLAKLAPIHHCNASRITQRTTAMHTNGVSVIRNKERISSNAMKSNQNSPPIPTRNFGLCALV